MVINYDKNGKLRIVVNGRSYRVLEERNKFFYILNNLRINCTRAVKGARAVNGGGPGQFDRMSSDVLTHVVGHMSTSTKEMFSRTSKENNDVTKKRIRELKRIIKLSDVDFTDAIKYLASFERKELYDFILERTFLPFGQDEQGIQEYEDMTRKLKLLEKQK